MAHSWNIFKMEKSDKTADKKSVTDILTEYIKMQMPIDRAGSVKEAFEKMEKMQDDPKMVVWMAFNGKNPNPITYPIVQAIACELGWIEGEKNHEWTLTMGLDEVDKKTSFKEAVILFYEEVGKQMDAHRMNHQILETMCWLSIKLPEDKETTILFYDTKDIAYELGWIKDGKLVTT